MLSSGRPGVPRGLPDGTALLHCTRSGALIRNLHLSGRQTVGLGREGGKKKAKEKREKEETLKLPLLFMPIEKAFGSQKGMDDGGHH